jgi:hypothetical protein
MAPARWLTRVVRAAPLLSAVLHCGPASADDSPPPRGPDKLACIAADTDGQALRMKGAFRAARRRFTGCAADSCPQIVRDDCFERIRELTRAQPWVIFDATNGNGRALHVVKVFMDSRLLLTERLDGRPIGVEPGEHTFTFRALGRFGEELKLTLREGAWEQHSVVLKTFAPGLIVEADAPVAAAEPHAPQGPATSPAPRVEIIRTENVSETSSPLFDLNSTRGRVEVSALGVGALGIAIGSVFGFLTISKWNKAEGECPNNVCRDSQGPTDSRAASSDGDVSTVAFAAGGAVLAAGAVLWLVDRQPTNGLGVRVVPSAGPRLGQITVQSRF